MSTESVDEDRPDGLDMSEEAQIAAIVGRLERRYPPARVGHADLERRVRGFYRQFDTARVRAFIAVLVERLVRAAIEPQRGSHA